MVEIHLRAPIEIVVDREGIELAALIGWEEYEALAADELHMQVWLEVVVAVVQCPRRADE